MINKLAHGLVTRAAPLAALAMGMALSGCTFVNNWEDVDGVPLAELDTSGDAPTHITLAGPDQVVISEGDSLAIELDGNAEAGDALRFERDGDRLKIARDRKVFDGSGKAIVRITMPAPSQISIAGSGDIEAAAMASEAEIDIAGSGSISVTSLDAERLDVDVAGSGTIVGAGSAETLTVDIAGSGDVRLGSLMADDVRVEIAGSGNVDLASNGSVSARIAGSGDVVVTGSASCTVSSAGSGSLTCRPADSSAEASAESAVEDDSDTEEAAVE